MHTAHELDQLSPELPGQADSLRAAFTTAKPFRHISIENFFATDFAERLLAEFPSFDQKLAINEGGTTGGKSVNTKVREISPAYRELYDLISSKPFLEFMSRVSGIPDLLLDPKMFGGGTHENRHGQELDPHIDFNYVEDHSLHRRLNLIVYLNKDWKTEWGGAIEIHSNPRLADENQIRAFDPLFNRAVMFETNEFSWHGFPKINLPESERHRSRKSISIYLYTRDRPAEEIAPSHGTFYVQRPLPPQMTAGHTLTAEEVADLKSLLVRRDRWIELYQKMEMDKNRSIDTLGRYVKILEARVRLPITGYAIQEGDTSGAFGDGWISSRLRTRLRPTRPVSGFTLNAFRPEEAGGGQVRIVIDSQEVSSQALPAGNSEVKAEFARDAGKSFDLEILFEPSRKWSPAGDDRDLALMAVEMRVEHAVGETGQKKTRRFGW
ncbi:MAG TPA: 2OG-Fe(II) oxygenase [Bryobacteraceae bacterium]|nr:2OG-Fe(II) oxygenase [Bryobacteraceae bacterium]